MPYNTPLKSDKIAHFINKNKKQKKMNCFQIWLKFSLIIILLLSREKSLIRMI